MDILKTSRALIILSLCIIAFLCLSGTAFSQEIGDGGEQSADVAVYNIHIDSNGNATWRIEIRRHLESENEINGFRSLMEDVRAGDEQIFTGIESDLEPLINEASGVTDREMSMVNINRGVEMQDAITGFTGVTWVNFTWVNFADTTENGYEIGDVFEGGGLYLSNNERLVISHDNTLRINGAVPDPDTEDDGILIWEGERFFQNGKPNVRYTKQATGLERILVSMGMSWTSLLMGIFILMGGFLGGMMAGRNPRIIRRIQGFRSSKADEDTETGGEADLITDQDRIIQLLQESDGRMKQADIVDRTGWSKSKVSMVLSEMEDNEDISKLRLGRENVIDLEE